MKHIESAKARGIIEEMQGREGAFIEREGEAVGEEG